MNILEAVFCFCFSEKKKKKPNTTNVVIKLI